MCRIMLPINIANQILYSKQIILFLLHFHISNEIHRVSARSLPGLRNESGSSYRPCRVCGGADASEYFVLPSGETYHTKANCSSLSYYVRAVPLSEVEHLGPCSYCGGG